MKKKRIQMRTKIVTPNTVIFVKFSCNQQQETIGESSSRTPSHAV